MKSKNFRAKQLLIISILLVLVTTPVLAENNGNNSNNNNNPGVEGNPGNSNKNSQNNNFNNQGAQANPGENSPQNNGAKNQNNSIQTIRPKVSGGQTIKFGDNDQNEVLEVTSEADSDINDDVQTIKTGKFTNISKATNSFSLDGAQSLSITPELFTFLEDNELLTDGAKVQIKINKASGNSNNTVEFLRIFSTDGGPDLMVRLHTNNQVNQLSVKAKPSSPFTSFITSILGFLNGLLGGATPSPSPSPTATPSATPSSTPSASPSESPSESPSPTPESTP